MTRFRLGICPARWERPHLTQLYQFIADPLEVDAYLLPESYLAEEKLDEVKAIAKQTRRWIFSGMEGNDGFAYAIAIDGEGNLVHRHLKIVEPAYGLQKLGDRLTLGTEVSAFHTPWGTFGFLLCYEIVFPEIARKAHDKGVKLFLNPIGDGGDFLEGMDFWPQMARVRAHENNAHIAGVSHSHSTNFTCYAANSGGQFYFNSGERLHMTRVQFDMSNFPTFILEDGYQKMLGHIQHHVY
ncbi:carbon-nitrogen hydrolase family protein [Dictyobacter formicarum]|uniref:CN hydrolase domain-containing protein n=1 Tax=Dictyobacter formicarum TaxID=2778368 RepID=A0ABQ3VUC6_9CHLR|nr:carbon-nitrogen hydrolase family protein [Dictyobacter formicarum]GHO89400.1 hypothetical protein KSZ_74060 [Dictyobacter formicarum]